MSGRRLSLTKLFEAVPLSEPLRTFKRNVEAVAYIAQQSSYSIEKNKALVQKWQEEDTKSKEESEKDLRDMKERLGEFRTLKKRMRLSKRLPTGKDEYHLDEQWVNMAIKDWQSLLAERKRLDNSWNSLLDRNLALLEKYEAASEVLMPMVFVYLVTIWDVFILDTVRRILGVHPELITVSDEEIKVDASFLWNVKSTEDLRNYLIEDKVSELDRKRKKLLEVFKEYWGIDWEMSGIALIDIIEIRARRDIWVHNQGMVNRQYLDMVGERTSLEDGQTAQIDTQYFDACLHKLTGLAVYIHRIAHRKHYAETDVG